MHTLVQHTYREENHTVDKQLNNIKELKSNNSKANIHPTCSRKTGRNKTSPKQRDKAVEPQKLFT
jgi:hypothetical protein